MDEHKRLTVCHQCGNQMQPGDQFCGSCGAVALPPAPQTEKVVPEPTPAQGATSRNSRRTLLFVGGVSVLLLLLVGGSATALLGSDDVHSEVPEGWAVATSDDEGGLQLVPEGYANEDVNDSMNSREGVEASFEEANIFFIEGSNCKEDSENLAPDDSSQWPTPLTSGYDTTTNTSAVMERGKATVAGHEATWGVSYMAMAGPWFIERGSSRAVDYPNYTNQLRLDVCVKDLNLSVSMNSSAQLSEYAWEDPEDEPTSARNATVPEAREEVHEELRRRYEANVGAMTELLGSVDTTGWDGSTDLSSIPTSLDGIDEELSDPFKGQLEELATAPEEPDDYGTTESTTPETTTPATQPNPDEEALEDFGREYDEANRGGDWEETYAMLDEESQQEFTEEEWAEKQQALRDADGPLSPLQSVSVDLPEGVSDTSGNVILYYQDGTSDTIVAGIPMAVTSEEDAGEPKRTLTEEEISYLEQVSADGGTDDLVAEAEGAAGDYYRAVGVGDFDYTYDALDSETQALFTREEWLQKNQWFAGNGEVIYAIESVSMNETSQEPLAEVSVRLTDEDGSSSLRETYFVYEGGEWLHRFGQEEIDLYGPGVQYEEWVEAKEDGANGYGDTAKGQREIFRSEAEEAAGDYYRASGSQDWDYTYDALDSETQALFTREEWSQKNQWFRDNAPAIYNIESVNMDETSQEPLAEVSVRLTGEDGSSSIRTTYFVNENGEWKHRFAQEEIDLFEPGVPFDEWVDAR